MNKETLWLTKNPDTDRVVLQLIYSNAGKYRTGWSRYFNDFYTEGWEWDERGKLKSTPIGVKGLIQW